MRALNTEFYPKFIKVNLADNVVGKVYAGKYTLKIIAMVNSLDQEPKYFTPHEILQYNAVNG